MLSIYRHEQYVTVEKKNVYKYIRIDITILMLNNYVEYGHLISYVCK